MGAPLNFCSCACIPAPAAMSTCAARRFLENSGQRCCSAAPPDFNVRLRCSGAHARLRCSGAHARLRCSGAHARLRCSGAHARLCIYQTSIHDGKIVKTDCHKAGSDADFWLALLRRFFDNSRQHLCAAGFQSVPSAQRRNLWHTCQLCILFYIQI